MENQEVLSNNRDDASNGLAGNGVHIRVQQRNGRKAITTIQGLDPRLNFNRINRELKDRWGCNGTVIVDKSFGTIIQLQGNWSEKITEFLLGERLASRNTLKVHSL